MATSRAYLRLTRIRPPSDLRSGDTSIEDLLKRESQLLHKYDGETPIEKASSEIPTYRESGHRSNGRLIYQKSGVIGIICMYLNMFFLYESEGWPAPAAGFLPFLPLNNQAFNMHGRCL
ncbi:hypothetical protein GIX45_04455 [Erwinia sp. CPCC 100877]|nr:hypothetical protein [Erwinia sp. CPCC 100877]